MAASKKDPKNESGGRTMWDYVKLTALAVVAVLAAMAANFAHDLPYQVNAIEVMLAAAIAFIFVLRRVGEVVHHDQSQYHGWCDQGRGDRHGLLGRRGFSGGRASSPFSWPFRR